MCKSWRPFCCFNKQSLKLSPRCLLPKRWMMEEHEFTLPRVVFLWVVQTISLQAKAFSLMKPKLPLKSAKGVWLYTLANSTVMQVHLWSTASGFGMFNFHAMIDKWHWCIFFFWCGQSHCCSQGHRHSIPTGLSPNSRLLCSEWEEERVHTPLH